MDAALMIEQFGAHPMGDKDQVLAAITRVWIATLYPAG
jgi:hypothetical protein